MKRKRGKKISLGKSLAHHQRRNTAGMLNDLKTAADVSLGVGEGLSLLVGHVGGKLLHIPLDQFLQLEHRLLAGKGRAESQICEDSVKKKG